MEITCRSCGHTDEYMDTNINSNKLAVPELMSIFSLPAVIDHIHRISLLAKRHPVNVLVAGKQDAANQLW
ncbi:MAG: hypothetical protein R2861_05775 [Desulfobacterales bacterium]